MIEVRPVSKDNWKSLIKLKVREDQRGFVASNLYSIAESHYGDDVPGEGHWDMFPYGIYDGEQPVGFLMFAVNYAAAKFQGFILRLMVDDEFQGKGFGRFGMNWMLDQFRDDENIKVVGISYEPHNETAWKLYASLGFVETGEFEDGEAIAVLKIRS